MAFLTHLPRALLLLAFVRVAVSSQRLVDEQLDSAQPTVVLDNATVVGLANETTGTIQYLGIPFAQPPCVNPRNITHYSTLT